MALAPHAVHRLHQYRQALSSTPFTARGKNTVRCPLCLLAQQWCTCSLRQSLNTQASFLLIMYDDEVLKPSNSGRLIADLIPDTYAYIWSRTLPNPALLALLSAEQYQVLLIFPAQYAMANQLVLHDNQLPNISNGKRPLFVMLDGTWREAVKMFRKSPYLHSLPVLSFSPEALATYALRKGRRDFQLGTAEVAALALAALNEPHNATALTAWFNLFVESSLRGKNNRPHHTLAPMSLFTNAFKEVMRETEQSNNIAKMQAHLQER